MREWIDCEQVVGTRGDVQPFLAIARELSRYGHRVRIATHSIYRKFVEDHKVEFYPLGGDPTILSEFVVRNRGILPGGGSKGLMNDIREQVCACIPPIHAHDGLLLELYCYHSHMLGFV